MFRGTDDKLTPSQVTVFMISTIVGSGVLIIPRVLSQATHTPDAWISVLVGGVITALAVWLIVRLGLYFPGKTVFEYGPQIVGKLPAQAICLLLILYFILTAGLEARIMVEVTAFFLLEGTPSWAILLPFIWVSAYLVSGGINSIARVFQLVFPVTILILLLCYLLSLKIFELNNLRPVLGSGIEPVIRSIPGSISFFNGIEAGLILTAFIEKPQYARKAMLSGIASVTFIYLITVIAVIGGISINSTDTSTWPTIDLIRSFEVTGFFFERLELPLMIIWLMQMFCTFTSFYYQASLGINQLFKIRMPVVIFALLPLIYLAAATMKSVDQLFSLSSFVGNCSIALFFLIPCTFSIVWLIRRKGLKQHG